MKLNDIIAVVAKELGTSDLKEINKLLKTEPAVRFRITSKALGHSGFTGHIKSISEEGVKAFMANKVSLIHMKDIEAFEKAGPRVERPVRTAKPESVVASAAVKAGAKKSKAPARLNDADDDDQDFADDEDLDEELRPKKFKKSKAKATGKSGSKFIPSFKK